MEVILLKVIEYLNDGEENNKKECCEISKACITCRSEISKIVETILEKVSVKNKIYFKSPKIKSLKGQTMNLN